MSFTPDKRELKVSCTVSALYLPDDGYLGGTFVSSESKTNNDRPGNYYKQHVYGGKSITLKSNTTNCNAYFLPLNPNIGAPQQTFVYGAIVNEAHPVLNLIKGPPEMGGINFASTVPLFNLNTPIWNVLQGSFSYYKSANPNILSNKNDYFPQFVNANTTYNIWVLDVTGQESKISYIKYQGYDFDKTYTGAKIIQEYEDDNTASITVHANNRVARLTRYYPIGQDLMYEGCSLVYDGSATRIINGAEVQNNYRYSESVSASAGSYNNGFSLRFKNSTASEATNPNIKANRSGIIIYFGSTATDSVAGYQIHLYEDTKFIKYYNPRSGSYDEMPLGDSGGISAGSVSTEVHVHFTGPNMMVGFSSDPSEWKTIFPIRKTEAGDYSSYYEHKLSAKAKISIEFVNITSTFTYAPIAFLNFDSSKINELTDAEFTASNFSYYVLNNTKARVNFSYNVPLEIGQQINIDDINRRFQSKFYSFNQYWSAINTATCLVDHRNQNALQAYIPSVPSTSSTNPRSVVVDGYVQYNTTVECPGFLKFLDDAKNVTNYALPTYDILYPMPWGDLSPYLSSAIVQYDAAGKTFGSLSSTATIVLKNIDSTERGTRILEALENNKLVFTISAGYDNLHTYFQGVASTVNTDRSQSGTNVTITLVDVGKEVLSSTRFITTARFGGMNFDDILDSMMAMSGAQHKYIVQRSSTDSAFSSYLANLNTRIGYNGFAALQQPFFEVNGRDRIWEKISDILTYMNNAKGLPVFFWDPADSVFKLSWRYEPVSCDTLKFAGFKNRFGVTEYPMNFEFNKDSPNALHGLIVGNYTVTTDLGNLHSGIVMTSLDQTATTLLRQEYYNGSAPRTWENTALTLSTISVLQSSIDGENKNVPQENIGYVGYRKFFYHPESGLPPDPHIGDKNSLNKYFNTIKPLVRKTYSTLKFSVYVTEPLSINGTFVIKTFIGEREPIITDKYIYKSCNYTIDKINNLITAEIEGVKNANIYN